MDKWDKIDAVQRMQDYIHLHIDSNITMENLCKAAGYSKWHSLRIFKEFTNRTPFEYMRILRLTKAAYSLRDGSDNVLDII